jgi:hypothetical protein
VHQQTAYLSPHINIWPSPSLGDLSLFFADRLLITTP